MFNERKPLDCEQITDATKESNWKDSVNCDGGNISTVVEDTVVTFWFWNLQIFTL